MTFTNSCFSSTQVGLSTTDGGTTFSTVTTTELQTASPEPSDGLAASLAGDAVAFGENTLSAGVIDGQLVASATATQLTGEASMLAVSQSPSDDSAFASAFTSAEVSGSPEVLFTLSTQTEISQQDGSGSTAVSSSTTEVFAFDLTLDLAAPVAIDTSTGSEDPVGGDVPASEPTSGGEESAGLSIDGNYAFLDLFGIAIGENTLVQVDASTLAIEDTLSISSGILDLAVN